MAKGAAYEREICTRLSEWWQPGRDDIFWRSSNSGGRATVRRRRGRATYGHEGDIAAVDPIGAPLLKLCAIEIKRGYTKHTFASILDVTEKSKQTMFEQWHQQVWTAMNNSKAHAWLLIVRRDRHEAVVFMPTSLYRSFEKQGCFDIKPRPHIRMHVSIRHKHPVEGSRTKHKMEFVRDSITAIRLDTFLDFVGPVHVRKVLKKLWHT